MSVFLGASRGFVIEMKKKHRFGVTMSVPLVDVLLSLLPLRSPSLSLRWLKRLKPRTDPIQYY